VNALVTGAAGFIGSHLVEALCAGGHAVVGVDSLTDYYGRELKRRNLEAVAHDRFHFVESDLLEADLQHLLDGVDHVYHLAGQPGVRASWSNGFDEYVRNNVLATQRLLEACVRAGIPRYVYASSSSVYGAPPVPTTECHVPAPISPYGVTKLAGEHLGGVYAHQFGLAVVSLRLFTVYGPRQRPDMATQRMINAALDELPFPIFGDGSQRRDFTYVSDVAAAMQLAASSEVQPGSVYNIGGGTDCSLSGLVSLVEQATGRVVRLDRHAPAAGDTLRTQADTSLARDELGWTPEHSLETGVGQQVTAELERRSSSKFDEAAER
jgi:UDP-glucuronate 4-epimerase